MFQWVNIKQPPVDTLSSLPATGRDESLSEDDIPVLMITEAQIERESLEKTQTFNTLRHNDGLKPWSLAAEFLQVVDGVDIERRLATGEFVIE